MTTQSSDAPFAGKVLVTGAAVGVGGVGMWGSMAALLQIGTEDTMAASWTLPFALDALAMVCTLAGVFARQSNGWVRWGPRLGYGASMALQATHAWQYGPRAVATHLMPLAASMLLSEVVIKMWAPPKAAAPPAAQAPPVPVETPRTVPEPTPAPVPERVPERVPARPRPAPAPSPAAARTVSLDDLVARARTEDAPRTIRGLKAHLGIGDAKARAVLDALTSGDTHEDASLLLTTYVPEDASRGRLHAVNGGRAHQEGTP